MKQIFGFALPAVAFALLATPMGPLQAQQYGPPPQQPSYQNGQQQPNHQNGQQQPGYQNGQQGYQNGQQQQGYQNGQRWDVPPPDFDDVNRRAFHDGMDAAHNDWQTRRPLDARRSMMFRRPPTDRWHRDQYRNSFARGYQVAVEHRDHWMDHDHDRWDHRDHDHDQNPR